MIAPHHKIGLIFVSVCVVIGAALAIAPPVATNSAEPAPSSDEGSSSDRAASNFADLKSDLVLDFPVERQDRRTLPNGSEFFGVSGSVINVGNSVTKVPPLLMRLKDDQGEVVYSWEVTSPKDILGPGESVTVNEAVTDIPASATTAEISWTK